LAPVEDLFMVGDPTGEVKMAAAGLAGPLHRPRKPLGGFAVMG
jgi:hypothetical protein